MKVFICKFFDEEDLEHRVDRLISRVKKGTGNNISVFCVDDQMQQRLEQAGIKSEILYDFHRRGTADVLSYEKAYQLSDELHSSAEHNDSLKYSTINFLSYEPNIEEYVLVIKFSNLCQRMTAQNCVTLVLVLTKPFNAWFPDINSANIKTIKYQRKAAIFLKIARLYSYARDQGYLLVKGLLILARNPRKKMTANEYPVVSPLLHPEAKRQQKILFVVTSSLYARAALAICEQCVTEGLVPYVATDDRDLLPLWQRHHIEHFPEPPFSLAVASHASTIPLYYRLRKHINSFYDKGAHHNAQSDEFSAAYLCRKVLLTFLFWLCYQAISDIAFLEKLIKETAPDTICLMPDGGRLQQQAAALAKNYSIPSLACSAALEIPGNAPAYMRHLHADKIAAMGEMIKNVYIESGLEPDRIVVTGVAHFDRLFNRDQKQDNQILLSCGVEPGKPIVLFITENLAISETEKMLTGVIEAMVKMKDTHLVVKVHPREEVATYQGIAARYPNSRICVTRDTDLYAWISNCALLITKFSTTALEAMLADKPVITINLSGKPDPIPYAAEGGAIGVYRYEDIEPAIIKVLYDAETRSRLKAGRDKFVRHWASEPDGKASHRIVTLIKEMATARSSERGKQRQR